MRSNWPLVLQDSGEAPQGMLAIVVADSRIACDAWQLKVPHPSYADQGPTQNFFEWICSGLCCAVRLVELNCLTKRVLINVEFVCGAP